MRLAPLDDTVIFWCLDGLGEDGALNLLYQEVVLPNSTHTGWELMLFCNHPQWWHRTTWWENGVQVPNPLPEHLCV